ncbi:hypothetical protein ccbrp13_12250 [Ktedonobacteria bacterium brp13]|nr:hypothetical protein ccbrp13_12250 [Ktedonobacteria bacterium brp13]
MVISFCLQKAVISALRRRRITSALITMTATDWENSSVEGVTLVDTINQITSAGSSWKPKTIDVPGILVDSSTLSEFTQQHPNALKS